MRAISFWDIMTILCKGVDIDFKENSDPKCVVEQLECMIEQLECELVE